MSDSNTSQGQVALVTGASRGIGAAIARTLASHGYRVIGTATTVEGADKITAALKSVEGADAACRGVVLNVTDGAAADALVNEIVKTDGGLHVLVNNAGITKDGLSMRMPDADWDAVIDTNLKAVFRMCRAVTRPMMKQRHGRIINITSVVGGAGNPGQANYCAAKAGVAGMTRSFARELAQRNITVNCVAPGFIATDMTAELPDNLKQALLTQIPLGRLGSGDDIASLVAFLAGPSAGYITGQEMHVNGGMFMA